MKCFVRKKSPCCLGLIELNELSFETVAKNIRPLMLTVICCTNEKIFTMAAAEKKARVTDCMHLQQQEERRRDILPAHTIEIHSVMASVSESNYIAQCPMS